MVEAFLSKKPAETTEEFLAKNPPTLVTVYTASWISVWNEMSHAGNDNNDDDGAKRNDALQRGRAILERLEKDLREGKSLNGKKMLKKDLREEAKSELLQVATTMNQTCGKWMFFFPPQTVNEKWDIIAREVVEGRLGCSAKVSTTNPNDSSSSHLICVYVDDFSDSAEVRRVFLRLQELGFHSKSFKPDFFTILDLYSKNPWGITPSIYTDKSILEGNE